MSIKLYAIKSKSTGVVERLVKAESQSQVKKHLAASFVIDTVGAIEVVELMANRNLVVEDATAVADDEASGAPAATAEGAVAGDGTVATAEGGSGEQATPATTD